MGIRRPLGPRDLAHTSSIKATDIEAALDRTLSQMGRGTPAPLELPAEIAASLPRPYTPSHSSPRKPAPIESDYVVVSAAPSVSDLPGSSLPPNPEPPITVPVVEPLAIKKRSLVRTRDEELHSRPMNGSLSDRVQPPSPIKTGHVYASTSRPLSSTSLGKHPASSRVTSLVEESWEAVSRDIMACLIKYPQYLYHSGRTIPPNRQES
jgi:hypothetical protein